MIVSSKRQTLLFELPPANKPKITQKEREKILRQVYDAIDKSRKLTHKVSRVVMREHRIYLYALLPYFGLSNRKQKEFTYARITITDNNLKECDLDWHRPNNRGWMVVRQGSLKECLQYIHNDDEWF